MGFLEETRSETGRVYRNKVDEIKETLSKKDCADFMEALNDITISQAAIVRALQKRGIKIGNGTISNLRRELLSNRGDINDVS